MNEPRNPFVPWYGTENMETDEPIVTTHNDDAEPRTEWRASAMEEQRAREKLPFFINYSRVNRSFSQTKPTTKTKGKKK